MIIPNHIQIETINGVCTARCTMCAFKSWTREPYRMKLWDFRKIMEGFEPYSKDIEYVSLFGFGEPLLDVSLPAKVMVAKNMGFRNVGFASNCTELDYSTSRALLEVGLDTLICSVDGLRQQTHEAIRVGTDFHKVVKNIWQFLDIRPRFGNTKVIIRFIRQKLNANEWVDFKRRWENRLNEKYGDKVISFDVVDCDGKVKGYKDKDVLEGVQVPTVCEQLWTRMMVLSDGRVALCCADDNGRFELGSALKEDPINLFNGERFEYYRNMMKEGRIGELELCKGCTIPRSQATKDK